MTEAYIDHGPYLQRLADGALLPKDAGNRDYAAAAQQIEAFPSLVTTPSQVAQLDQVKVATLAEIDAAAERARLRYITPGAGQAQTYAQKLAQAVAYVAAGAPPDATPWPFVAGEAEALEISPEAAAATIIATAEAWVTVGVAIERTRMAGKRAVSNATAVAPLTAARDGAINTLEAL